MGNARKDKNLLLLEFMRREIRANRKASVMIEGKIEAPKEISEGVSVTHYSNTTVLSTTKAWAQSILHTLLYFSLLT